MSKTEEEISKTMSYTLRHHPEKFNLILDKEGWTPIVPLLHNLNITREQLQSIVDNNDKKRFEIDETNSKIRASQGHSIKVDLGYKEETPPLILYHGTSYKNSKIIEKEGLKKMKRHHVHLSADSTTATTVGKRHCKMDELPSILLVNTRYAMSLGIKFYKSTNDVWLSDDIPSECLVDLVSCGSVYVEESHLD